MILEFEDEKRLLDDATRELMQTCSQAAQKAEGGNEAKRDPVADPRHAVETPGE